MLKIIILRKMIKNFAPTTKKNLKDAIEFMGVMIKIKQLRKLW